MAAGCLTTIALCGVVGYAALITLPLAPSGDPTVTRIFAALIGCIGGLGLHSVWSLIRGYGRGTGARTALHARAKSDEAPQDGQPIIATGTLRLDQPLISPIGGVPCAAYDYRMFVVTRAGSESNEVPVYWGYASRPFTLDSRSRRYHVSGAVFHHADATRLTGDEAVARARGYIRSTRWETVEYRLLGTLDTVRQRLEDNAPQGTRRDFAADTAETREAALLLLEETVLPINETVSAFGTWASSQGAVVAPPSPLPGSHVVVARGGPEALDSRAGVPQSTTSYVITALVLLGLAGGLFYVGSLIIPTLRG